MSKKLRLLPVTKITIPRRGGGARFCVMEDAEGRREESITGDTDT
jgi:hypothetical protein